MMISNATSDARAGGNADRGEHEAAAKNLSLVQKLADAVLYEGYILYPYRPSSVKNRQRFNFGGLYPPAYSESQAGTDACRMQCEVLLVGEQATIDVRVRFLHLITQEVCRLVEPGSACRSAPAFEVIPSVEFDGRVYYTWQEAVERDVELLEMSVRDLVSQPVSRSFFFGPSYEATPLRDASGELVATVTRSQEEILGNVEITAQELSAPTGAGELFRVRIAIENRTALPATFRGKPGDGLHPNRDEALRQTMASTHAVLSVDAGEFVSLLDPPENLRDEAAACGNVGVWPVLVGAEGERDTMLASPIILYDYPQIAAESPGDLCDGLEIDEILTLRIMTLTDEEKREMRGVDARARAILERTERLPQEHLLKMHGVVRGARCEGEN